MNNKFLLNRNKEFWLFNVFMFMNIYTIICWQSEEFANLIFLVFVFLLLLSKRIFIISIILN